MIERKNKKSDPFFKTGFGSDVPPFSTGDEVLENIKEIQQRKIEIKKPKISSERTKSDFVSILRDNKLPGHFS